MRAGHEVSLVVTQPDRPKGRGMELALSPVKQKAIELGLPIAQPEKIKNNAEFRAQLEAIAPECIVIVGYGRIIPRWMLDLPPHGNINLHASLLPKYRGAAPIQWAIASGESVTGNTTMRIDEGLDTGDILLQREMAILAGRHQRDAGSAAGGDGSGAAGGNPGSAGGAAATAHAAGSCARDPGADSDARRWTHRFCPRLRRRSAIAIAAFSRGPERSPPFAASSLRCMQSRRGWRSSCAAGRRDCGGRRAAAGGLRRGIRRLRSASCNWKASAA